jgi:hypothetical protein
MRVAQPDGETYLNLMEKSLPEVKRCDIYVQIISVEPVVGLLVRQLRHLRNVHVTVKRVVRVQSVSILTPVVVSPQDRVWLPPLPVQVGVVGAEPAALGRGFLGLEVLVSGSEGGVE